MLKVKHGDTLAEVGFAVAVFALVSVIAINIMSAGLNSSQAAMEAAQVRNEIDAQAEALRFIHNAFTLERELVVENQQYRGLWLKLTNAVSASDSGMANEPSNLPEFSVDTCSQIYDGGSKSIFKNGVVAFIINTREIDPRDKSLAGSSNLDNIVISTKAKKDMFRETTLYPRVLYSTSTGNTSANNSDSQLYESDSYRYVAAAEGISIIAIRDRTVNANTASSIPEFFDFHIRACWYSPGQDNPSLIGTTIRLYNPEIVEDAK